MYALNKNDLKQIRLIEKKLFLFENNKINLFNLVRDLGGLLNTLESVPDAWKNDLQAEINTLEMIHDNIEDGSISKWQGNAKEEIHQSVSKLRTLTACLMEEYLKVPDSNISESAIEADSTWLMCPKCNDAWKSVSSNAMVVCPNCECAFRNPRASITREIST